MQRKFESIIIFITILLWQPRNAGAEVQNTCVMQRTPFAVAPDGEVFIYDTPPPLGALPGGRQGRQTHVHGWELPLRWDLLSQGRGLFLKQTHPSTDRRLVSEPAARA